VYVTYEGRSEPVFDETYEAEDSDFNILGSQTATAVTTESTVSGYSGIGYVTGLNTSAEDGDYSDESFRSQIITVTLKKGKNSNLRDNSFQHLCYSNNVKVDNCSWRYMQCLCAARWLAVICQRWSRDRHRRQVAES
jgi:hypothetical protein